MARVALSTRAVLVHGTDTPSDSNYWAVKPYRFSKLPVIKKHLTITVPSTQKANA